MAGDAGASIPGGDNRKCSAPSGEKAQFGPWIQMCTDHFFRHFVFIPTLHKLLKESPVVWRAANSVGGWVTYRATATLHNPLERLYLLLPHFRYCLQY